MRERHPIFDEARKRVAIDAVAGVTLRRRGGQDVGPCPLCTKGVKKGDWFKVKDDSAWFCHRCGKGGDVIALEQALGGGTMMEAAVRLIGGDYEPRQAPPATPVDPTQTSSAQRAKELWTAGTPLQGSLGETYLLARGIAPEVIAAVGANLRFHRRAKWWWHSEERVWKHAPAILALVVVAGEDARPVATGGIHATFLKPDGSGKAVAIDAEGEPVKAKKMMGPQGRDGRAGGTWLIGPNAPWLDGVSGAVGGEGIETSLSLATLSFLRHGVIPRAWAALSLDRLQGRLLKDRQGCVDLNLLTPDPDSPAFVWPGLDDVEIGVDRDMGTVPIRGRTGRGKPVMYDLGGEARAKLCARMAVAAWKAAGAKRVHAIAPPPGMDFNNELGRVLARRAQVEVAA